MCCACFVQCKDTGDSEDPYGAVLPHFVLFEQERQKDEHSTIIWTQRSRSYTKVKVRETSPQTTTAFNACCLNIILQNTNISFRFTAANGSQYNAQKQPAVVHNMYMWYIPNTPMYIPYSHKVCFPWSNLRKIQTLALLLPLLQDYFLLTPYITSTCSIYIDRFYIYMYNTGLCHATFIQLTPRSAS